MRLLFDENLSRKLVSRLTDLFPGSMHVAEAGLIESPDREVWEFARANGCVIVSTDADFYELAMTIGPPPKVILAAPLDAPTNDAEDLLRRSALRITDFERDPELGILILDKK